jgi:NitT/TauT family transport system ATP-binding protein
VAVSIELDSVGKVYRTRRGSVRALDDISFSVDPNEFVSIVGPSGCGKSTLLMLVSGLYEMTSGQIRIGGKPISGPPDGLSTVFQDYSRSLFPWFTVGGNVGLPLRTTKTPKEERTQRVEEMLAAVGLEGTASRHPWQLSGGMQQRVAIARALVTAPTVMLMDEPFAAVDAQTRMELEDLVLQLWTQFDMTVLFVTHDIDEAVYLADRVVVFEKDGRVAEIVDVGLSRPRHQVDTKSEPEFSKLRRRVFELVTGAHRKDTGNDRPARPTTP